ncbi:MAG: hypothetical protein ACI4GZ_00185 [Ruminococcus sp.]
MKKYVFWSILLLLILALFPTAVVLSGGKFESASLTDAARAGATRDEQSTESDTETKEKRKREDTVTASMKYIDGSTSKEAQKAILALVKNNYEYFEEQGLSADKTDISSYSDELYKELCNEYDELELNLSFEGEKRYIPLTESCGGNTSTSDEYPYMISVASPWDAERSDFSRTFDYNCGVSIYGINYLCESGENCTDALKWYLPNFEISQQS